VKFTVWSAVKFMVCCALNFAVWRAVKFMVQMT
jgi:hypothetical protein